MSLTKLSLDGKNLIIPVQGEFDKYLLTSSVQRLDPQIPVLLTCTYRYLLTSSVQSLDPQIPTYL